LRRKTTVSTIAIVSGPKIENATITAVHVDAV
jgi:hypothetical protein